MLLEPLASVDWEFLKMNGTINNVTTNNDTSQQQLTTDSIFSYVSLQNLLHLFHTPAHIIIVHL